MSTGSVHLPSTNFVSTIFNLTTLSVLFATWLLLRVRYITFPSALKDAGPSLNLLSWFFANNSGERKLLSFPEAKYNVRNGFPVHVCVRSFAPDSRDEVKTTPSLNTTGQK